MDGNDIVIEPMRTDEVVARLRQRVIDARLRNLQEVVRSALCSSHPDTAKIDDEVYHLKAIVALDPYEDTGDILQTYLEFYNVYDVLEEKGPTEVYSIVFNMIHHIAFTYKEKVYPIIPSNVRD